MTNGRAADGRFAVEELPQASVKPVVLFDHLAFRLSGDTLEPVARRGDIVLVRAGGLASPGALVVALAGDRILARRFTLADNDSDLAALVAQPLSPKRIIAPVIAHRGSLQMLPIVGVLYQEASWPPLPPTTDEVCPCGGEAVVKGISGAGFLGLVRVAGDSAEPLALDKQYLIIKGAVPLDPGMKILEGKPVVASDEQDARYFKRLRGKDLDRVVLESLHSGGDYGPVVLNRPGEGGNALQKIWPVVGVIFELP